MERGATPPISADIHPRMHLRPTWQSSMEATCHEKDFDHRSAKINYSWLTPRKQDTPAGAVTVISEWLKKSDGYVFLF